MRNRSKELLGDEERKLCNRPRYALVDRNITLNIERDGEVSNEECSVQRYFERPRRRRGGWTALLLHARPMQEGRQGSRGPLESLRVPLSHTPVHHHTKEKSGN